MLDLEHVSDEDVIELNNVVGKLMENLSGGFNNPEIWDRGIEILDSCVFYAKVSGSYEENKHLFYNKDDLIA